MAVGRGVSVAVPSGRREHAWLFIKQVVQVGAGGPRAGAGGAVQVEGAGAEVARDDAGPDVGRLGRGRAEVAAAPARRGPQRAHADRVALRVAAAAAGDGRGGGVETRGEEAGRVAVGSADAAGSGAGGGGREEEVRLAGRCRGRGAAVGPPSGAAGQARAGEGGGGFALNVLVKLSWGCRERGSVLVAWPAAVVDGVLGKGGTLDRPVQEAGNDGAPEQDCDTKGA